MTSNWRGLQEGRSLPYIMTIHPTTLRTACHALCDSCGRTWPLSPRRLHPPRLALSLTFSGKLKQESESCHLPLLALASQSSVRPTASVMESTQVPPVSPMFWRQRPWRKKGSGFEARPLVSRRAEAAFHPIDCSHFPTNNKTNKIFKGSVWSHHSFSLPGEGILELVKRLFQQR